MKEKSPTNRTTSAKISTQDTKTDMSVSDLVSRAMRAPILSWEEEKSLATAWRQRQCQQSLAKLIASYSRLVIKIAVKFKSYGLPVSDLIQEGHVGILEAANRFDPEKGYRFSTYATWWIQSIIQDFVIKNISIVRMTTSSSQKKLYFNLRKLKAKIRLEGDLSGRLGPSEIHQLSKTLGVDAESIVRMENFISIPDQSLNAPVSEYYSSDDLQSSVVDESPSPEDATIEKLDQERYQHIMRKALQHLNERERKVVHERFLGDQPKTLAEIGRSWGLTKERIRQIEGQAISKLRQILSAMIPNPSEVF